MFSSWRRPQWLGCLGLLLCGGQMTMAIELDLGNTRMLHSAPRFLHIGGLMYDSAMDRIDQKRRSYSGS